MRARRHDLWLLPLALLAQRLVLFVRYGGDLGALFRANPHWAMVQLQAIDALDAQPFAALWYLQQAPPVPNIVMAALLQVLPWPVGVGWGLMVVELLCTLVVAMLIVDVARRLVRPPIATALGLFWVWSPDVVVMETAGLGQSLYENLAALGVMACAFCFLRWCESSDRRWVIGLGIGAGLLALTRSSYGFYVFPLLAVMPAWALLRAPAQRRAALRQVLLCAALALSIQGAWAFKNLVVFGHFTWPASTWGGASLAATLEPVGAGDELAAMILSEPERYEPWFVAYVEDHGARPWSFDWNGADFCPPSARAQDLRVSEFLHGRDRTENGQCMRRVSEAFGDAALRFLLRHPNVLLTKIKLGYATYWFPIRYHGGQYLSLFATDIVVDRSLRPWRSAAQLLAGELPEQAYVLAGSWSLKNDASGMTRRPASLFTPDLLATVWWLVEIVVLHLVVPFVVLTILWRTLRSRQIPSRDAVVLMLAVTFLYSAGIHNLVELGENMRFRWTVEAVIWLLVADALTRLGGWLTDAARLVQRKTSR